MIIPISRPFRNAVIFTNASDADIQNASSVYLTFWHASYFTRSTQPLLSQLIFSLNVLHPFIYFILVLQLIVGALDLRKIISRFIVD